MKKKRVDALTIKKGPTESGATNQNHGVGGEILSIDKLQLILSQHWLLILLLLIPFGFLLYKKRNMVLRILTR